jgi:predicted membrane protein
MSHATRPLRVCAVSLVVVLALWLIPALAFAGRNSMIPPGQEQRIRGFVDEALAAARAAGELPAELDETVDIHIDRDRVRVILHARDAAALPELPLLLVFHPEAVPEDIEGALAPGVLLRCGPIGAQRNCEAAEAEPWRPLAGHLAAARAPVADLVWQVEEISGPPPEPADVEVVRRRQGVWLDRAAGLLAALLGLAVAGFGVWRGRGRPEALRWPELSALVLLVLAFVGATLHFTPMLPLHEHNSFIARSDCAIDPECVDASGSAWGMTTLHVYGWLLTAIPYRAHALAGLSLACSVVGLVLVWALGRTLMRALHRPALGPVAGLTAAGVLAAHPVAWRLAGAETFWPWSVLCMLAAALAGVWAGLAVADDDRRTRIIGALAWLVAALWLALACAGNYVLLTLGVCLGLAPSCWTPAWRGGGRAAIVRLLLIGLPALGLFAVVVSTDYVAGYLRAFGDNGLDGSVSGLEIWRRFRPLLFDLRVTAPVWIVPSIAALAWLWPMPSAPGGPRDYSAPLRLVPLLYAWAIPTAILGIAAGDIIGSGYPVGFINHHWDLWLTALAAGLGTAFIVSLLDRRPLQALLLDRIPSFPSFLSWSLVLPSALVLTAALFGPRVEEGWRMATGERVLERELVALEAAFEQLPEHDLLIVPPQVLEPTTDAPTEWDPLEVFFPMGFYNAAMRARELEPAPIVELDKLQEPRPGARILLYVGSSLRSFQPHEIAAGAVPDDLDRPVLRAMHDAWEFEPVYEFTIETQQHPEISQRLGADRVSEVGLGFYWLRPR